MIRRISKKCQGYIFEECLKNIQFQIESLSLEEFEEFCRLFPCSNGTYCFEVRSSGFYKSRSVGATTQINYNAIYSCTWKPSCFKLPTDRIIRYKSLTELYNRFNRFKKLQVFL